MPLIDLDSMSGEQLKEEARQWTLEPSNYSNDNELKAAIKSKRETNAARHGIDQADVDSGMAAKPDSPGSEGHKRKPVADLKDKDIVDSVQEATVTRPTPGEPENTNKKADDAQKKMENRDTAVGKPQQKTDLKHTPAKTK